MCGRYVSPEQGAIEREWRVGRGNNNPFPRRYNVSPTMSVPILLRARSGALGLESARWGLIPHWWKEAKPPRFGFNARCEDIGTKPMWRHPLRHSRCLVPAEGWYEWRQVERSDPDTGEAVRARQPYFICRRDARPFCFAGLMSVWYGIDGGDPLPSCSILTRPASASVSAVHDRMPVVLPDEAYTAWLDPQQTDAGRACEIVHECAVAQFDHRLVSAKVNSSDIDEADLIEPATVT
jgi:putative SOS response-associated peptidase YedK